MESNQIINIVVYSLAFAITIFLFFGIPLLIVAYGYAYVKHKRAFRVSDLEPLLSRLSPALEKIKPFVLRKLGQTALNTPRAIGKLFLIVIALILWPISLYFLPSILGQKKKNFGAIFALNLFLGWTVFGWIIALVWSLTKD